MSNPETVISGWFRWCRQIGNGLAVFVRDVGNGMLEVSHNLLALVGLAVLAAVVFVAGQAELRQAVEVRAFSWLHDRHSPKPTELGTSASIAAVAEPSAIDRVTAIELKKLPQSQAAVAQWLSRRYRVATEPVARLVQEAWSLGSKANLEPTLILAIMAIESSFNPFAQSTVGAQGLMQVMTRVHDDKFVAFGGNHAAFDPVANLRVGVQILKDCIARAGSIEGGLRHYVGAANLPDDGGYAARVLAEQSHLKLVVAGKTVAPDAPRNTAAFMTLPPSVQITQAAPATSVAAADASLASTKATSTTLASALLPAPGEAHTSSRGLIGAAAGIGAPAHPFVPTPVSGYPLGEPGVPPALSVPSSAAVPGAPSTAVPAAASPPTVPTVGPVSGGSGSVDPTLAFPGTPSARLAGL